jgi:hypothetical protein
MRIQNLISLAVVLGTATLFACSSSTGGGTGAVGNGGSNTTGTGGKGTAGGPVAGTAATTGGTTGVTAPTGGIGNLPTGGKANVGGNAPTGGTTSNAPTGGKANVGGNAPTGGSAVTISTGGNTGVAQPTGGKANVGGNAPTGGSAVTVSTGGNTGVAQPTGGKANGGATSATGGTPGGGGVANTGGKSSNGGGTGCSNTNTSAINEDASGYVCNNTWGIKGAWYCYSDGSDSSTSCKGSDGKGAGAIPWNAASSAMCLSGTMGTGSGSYAGIGFKVNSGPPGDTATPGTWNASNIVGFAVTLTSGASGKGTGGMVLNIEYPTSTDLDTQTKDAPGITVPGVGSSAITYNALFSDSVLANNKLQKHPVDPANLTDVKIAFFPDSISHTYDFCIKSIVPLTTAPNPVVATGNYGPSWNNQMPQAVNGINGYAVQSAPFPTNGNPMTMQVKATASGVGFTYTTGGSFQAPNNGPGSFPAVISGWGPGHDGIQFYGPYKGGKQIGQLTSVKSTWSFTMGSSGNAAYDVWFSNSSAAPPVPGIELMIWIGNTGKNPLGSVASPGTAVSGRTPYVGTNGTGESVVSYWVASPGTTSVSNFDLMPYFQDAASHGYAGLKTASYLLGVQTGFEVYSGSWSITDYNITIQ